MRSHAVPVALVGEWSMPVRSRADGYRAVTAHVPKLEAGPAAVEDRDTAAPKRLLESHAPSPGENMHRKVLFTAAASYTQRFPGRAAGFAAVPGQFGVDAPPTGMKFALCADGELASGSGNVKADNMCWCAAVATIAAP